MFSEKLIIKNFGPFTEQVEFEFNKYSIIIGPQASGKSIVAKLITIFRNSKLVDTFEESLNKFNILIFVTKNTEVYYFSHFYNAIFQNGKIDIKFDKDIEKMFNSNLDGEVTILSEYLNNLNKLQTDHPNKNNNTLQNEIFELKKQINLLFIKLGYHKKENLDSFGKAVSTPHFKDSYYIPSERLFYSMFRESISSIIYADVPLPTILIEFGAMIESFRNKNKHTPLQFQDIKFEHGGDELIVSKGDNKILISFASSGIQSLYPILLICQALKDKQIEAKEENEYTSIAIEEPELNLFPQAQNELIKKIIECVNSNDNVRLTITTHSPYILTTINNLLFKSKIEKLMQSKETSSTIDLNDKINFEDISAYYIEDGKAENLLDPQTQLINAKKLDAISYTINSEFSELMATYRKLNA